ncbi:MAG: zinc ABC transporter substrate-binding protein [Anaerolineae bacterium]
MLRREILWLMGWLVILTWVVPACGPVEPVAAPAGDETVSGPTSVEEHEAGPEAGVVDLEPVSLGPGEKLRVVATTNIIAHVVSQVGGEAIQLIELLPTGADPHTYIPTPKDVAAVAGAHVVFANGADLEAEFLPRLTQDTDTPVVFVSNGVEFRELGQAQEHEEEDHSHRGLDPHTWTTPANVIVFVRNIEHALSALDPAHAGTYQANAQAYAATLEALDEWVEAQIETIPAENRELVTDHAAFGYYADRYGLEQIGAVIPAFSTAAEPSAQELAALEDAIREYGVKAVFVGTTVNPALSEQVARDTGVQLVTLYTGSLGPEGSGVETYIAYICHNTLAIVQALGGTAEVAGSPCE